MIDKRHTIAHITAEEILDSRGDPTVQATVVLADGTEASASVPAGASTGSHEARELRDGGRRFGGKGVLKAVDYVRGEINEMLAGMDVSEQREIDRRMVERDGTPDRSRLGANALLSVSLACARAASVALKMPLYRYLQQRFELPHTNIFPKPMCNVINGGKHADNSNSFQEYLVLPEGGSVSELIERVWRVIRNLKEILQQRGDRTLVGDEGGFAPIVRTNEEGLELLRAAATNAGLNLGDDVSFGLDVAASEFYDAPSGAYTLEPEHRKLNAAGLIEMYDDLSKKYPLRTLEDGLTEDDWSNWTKLTQRLGSRLMLIGDDLFVTQKDRLRQGIRAHAANAIVIKPNQVGTLSETVDTIATARDERYTCIVSHRSGETTDDFITDLAVAVGSPYLKAGSLTRGERLAKYNRLLAIASEVGA